MTKVYLDIEKLNSRTIPNIESAINNLNSAIAVIEGAPKPEFSMSGYVGSLPGKLGTIVSKCEGTIKWIGDCSSKFSAFNNEAETNFNNIVVEEIKEKEEQIGNI